MKILMKLRYDGGAYCGFQAQPNGVSVQSVLTDAAARLFGFPCDITGCSRTDSGVHARGFCATVSPREAARRGESWCSIPPGRFHRAINTLLPPDIAVCAAASVPDDFHARYNVAEKTYEYCIYDDPARDPFLRGRVYPSPRKIDGAGLHRMQETAALFIGTHDFSGYMAAGSRITDARRTVRAAEVERMVDGQIVFRVTADGFLYNMVRIMAGTLLECAWGRRTADDALAALNTGVRSRAGFTAPPEGLYLCEVLYDRVIDWKCE